MKYILQTNILYLPLYCHAMEHALKQNKMEDKTGLTMGKEYYFDSDFKSYGAYLGVDPSDSEIVNFSIGYNDCYGEHMGTIPFINKPQIGMTLKEDHHAEQL